MANELIPYVDIEKMGRAIAQSKLFGIQTPEQAIALMLIAQAEGMHPAIAARDYNIIQGRPALKADAMLARFQAAGGCVQWTELSDKRVSAIFSHAQGGKVELDWTIERAKQAGLGGKDMWSKYPRQMLRARVISEGIRTVYPGCMAGFYTPEEVQDMEPIKTEPLNITPPQSNSEASPDAPQGKSEPQSIIAVIDEITTATGETKGKPWTKYGIKSGDVIYGTFDKKIADAAEFWKGQEVKITFEQKGKFLTCLSVVEPDVVEG